MEIRVNRLDCHLPEYHFITLFNWRRIKPFSNTNSHFTGNRNFGTLNGFYITPAIAEIFRQLDVEIT